MIQRRNRQRKVVLPKPPIVIVRNRYPEQERAVEVVFNKHARIPVNPRTAVGHATGYHPPRSYCIISLAAGLQDGACRSVQFHQLGLFDQTVHIWTENWRQYGNCIKPAYYALGYLIATGLWFKTVHYLQEHVATEERFAVLEGIGIHFFSAHPCLPRVLSKKQRSQEVGRIVLTLTQYPLV